MIASLLQVACRSRRVHCEDRSAEWDKVRSSLCGTLETRQSLLQGTPELYWARNWPGARLHNEGPAGLSSVLPRFGWFSVQIPGQSWLSSCLGVVLVCGWVVLVCGRVVLVCGWVVLLLCAKVIFSFEAAAVVTVK